MEQTAIANITEKMLITSALVLFKLCTPLLPAAMVIGDIVRFDRL